MQGSERLLERNEAFERARAEQAVERIRSNLKGIGVEFCEDCEEPVGEARRKAMPSATRCISCQSVVERRRR